MYSSSVNNINIYSQLSKINNNKILTGQDPFGSHKSRHAGIYTRDKI